MSAVDNSSCRRSSSYLTPGSRENPLKHSSSASAAPVSGVETLGGRLAMPSQDANHNRRNDPARRNIDPMYRESDCFF